MSKIVEIKIKRHRGGERCPHVGIKLGFVVISTASDIRPKVSLDLFPPSFPWPAPGSSSVVPRLFTVVSARPRTCCTGVPSSVVSQFLRSSNCLTDCPFQLSTITPFFVCVCKRQCKSHPVVLCARKSLCPLAHSHTRAHSATTTSHCLFNSPSLRPRPHPLTKRLCVQIAEALSWRCLSSYERSQLSKIFMPSDGRYMYPHPPPNMSYDYGAYPPNTYDNSQYPPGHPGAPQRHPNHVNAKIPHSFTCNSLP